jgi:hypothetical protein
MTRARSEGLRVRGQPTPGEARRPVQGEDEQRPVEKNSYHHKTLRRARMECKALLPGAVNDHGFGLQAEDGV